MNKLTNYGIVQLSIAVLAAFMVFALTTGQAGELTLYPFDYNQGFETEDPFTVWAHNGTYTIHYKGITNETCTSGTNAFKLDVTFGTNNTYLNLSINTRVPNYGELQFRGRLRSETSTSSARVSWGLNTSVSPAPYTGTERISYAISSTAGLWVTQEIADVVAAAERKAGSLMNHYCGGAIPEDTGKYTTRIALYMSGPTGSHFTVYLDDCRLWGSVPDKADYDPMVEANWDAYRARIQADVNGRVSNIVHYPQPVTYAPDVILYSNMVDRSVATSNSVASRTYPWPDDYAALLYDHDASA